MKFGNPRNSIFVIVLCLFVLCLFTFTGCNSDSDSTTGTLETSLTDASTDKFQSVYVTIEDVMVHKADGEWESVMAEEKKNKQYDLLKLVNGVKEKLGTHELETGKYTQMRLMIGETNYVVDSDGTEQELFIPSGRQSGIKLVHPFNITNTATTHLILDFDASESVVETGNQRYILKPTIKIIEEKTSAYVKGQVNGTDSGNMTGTKMSLQTYNSSDQVDPKDRVDVLTHTLADQNSTQENAGYQLQIKGGTYNLVGYKPGYQPEIIQLEVEEEETYIRNMTLQASNTGVVNGTLNGIVTVEKEHQYIDVDFLRKIENTMVEIDGKTIAVDTNTSPFEKRFNATLSYGNYTLVASTNGSETIGKNIVTNSTFSNATNLQFDFNSQ